MSKDTTDRSEAVSSSEVDDMEEPSQVNATKVAIEYSSGSSSSSNSSSDSEEDENIDPGLPRKELSLLDDDEPALIRTEIEEAGEEEELIGLLALLCLFYINSINICISVC